MRPLALALPFAVVALVAQAPPVVLDADALAGLQARNIGPAIMSGRISAIDGVMEKGRLTLYVGAASGGIWKSMNSGTTWKPVFDKYAQSIGAIKVDPKDPRTVWVGTGEPWVRNSVGIGEGLYKTTDGGETWNLMGLPHSERIGAIAIDPTDSNTVYVAALGHLWSSGGERGLFKTTDGGKTWERILYTDEDSGCSGLSLDPSNPKILFASMWQHRRQPWSFESGGAGSGLFKSTDAGKTWTRLTDDPKRGLPAGKLGRIAVTIAPSDSKKVYATVEAKDGAIFRSDDGGETWNRGNNGANITIRPFYFSALFVDPKDPMKVYKPGLNLAASEDGGVSFSTLGGSVHSDHHAMLFHPQNPEIMYLGTDGGLFVSEDRGNTWRMVRNLPVGQFYHVSVDEGRPYKVFGGLQDNSTWMGYSSVWLANKHWTNLYGGDGFWALPDTSDPDYVYVEYQGGTLVRVNTKTLTSAAVQPKETAEESKRDGGKFKFRWNWNTPMAMSPTNKGVIYFGSQILFRSKDKGNTWERLSGDLSNNDPSKQKQEDSGGLTLDNSAAETYGTIYSISESPKNPKVLWVGTDDGNVQLSKDGGNPKTWTNLRSKIPGLPKVAGVSWIEASSHAEGTAFVAFDAHGVGDMTPYVYRTDDFGQTWKSIATPELSGYAHVVKQDPVRANLLYLGTEFGLFISVDGGANWAPFKGSDFPKVAVRDMAFQTREHDLVLATHGRGLWIIDDLTSLRALTPETLAKDVALLPTRPAASLDRGGDGWSDGDQEYSGQDRSGGATIAFWQKKRHLIGEMKVEILDEKGNVLRTLPGSKRRGFNRITWDRQLRLPRAASGANFMDGVIFQAPEVLDGTYGVRLTKGKEVLTGTLKLEADPSSPVTRADREVKWNASMELFRLVEDLAFRADQVLVLRNAARAQAASADPSRKAKLEAFADAVEVERAKLVSTKESNGAITGEERLREKVSGLYRGVFGQPGRPSPEQLARVKALQGELAESIKAIEALAAKELPALNAGQPAEQALALETRAAWDQKTAAK
ncbi:MAG TPA: hypothetical protein VJ505_05210 [Holophagaceae bacterium]|nr:hypothetical protein [Holophagaceae bacterium]